MKLELILQKKKPLIIITLVLSFIVVAGGFSYYNHEAGDIRFEKHSVLKAIAELKVADLIQWKNERLSEAEFFSSDDLFIQNTQKLLSDKNSKSLKEYFTNTLSTIAVNHKYQNIFIISDKSSFIFNLYAENYKIDSITSDFADKVFEKREIIFSDFYTCETHNCIHFDILAPIFNNDKCIAVLLFRINPNDFLFPLIQKWPMPYKTGETLLVRKNNGYVEYLNNLRFKNNLNISLKIPDSNNEILASLAFKDKTGIIEAKDYRNVDVLADIVPVNNTPWIMIAKVDISEIYEELWFRALFIILLSGLSILLLAAGISFIYKYRQSGVYKSYLLKEKELRENEELFRITLYSIGDGVITTDAYGRVKHMNKVAEDLTGWKEADAQNKAIENVFDIINEDSRRKVENPVDRVLTEGLIVGLANHTLLVSKNGKVTSIADSGAPIKTENDEIIGVVLVFRDQTEEHKATRILEQSRNDLREAQAVAKLGNYVWEFSTNIWSSSDILNEIFGIDQNYNRSLEGWANIVHPDFREMMLNYVTNEVIAKKQRFDKEYKIVRVFDGIERWVHGLGELEFDEQNNPVKLFGTITDITERKNYELNLKRSEEDYKTLFNQGHDPIIIFVPEDETILDVNDKACHVYGFSKEEFIGMSLTKISNNINAGKERINTVINDGWIRGFETTQFKKDGSEIIVEINATKINYQNRVAILSTNRDITKRKKAEEKLIENEERMRVIVEGTPNLFFYTQDAAAKIKYISPSVEKITGHKVKDWINESHWFITDNEINKLAIEYTHKHLKGEFTSAPINVEIQHADNYAILLEVYENPIIKNGIVTGLQGVAHDITARRKAEIALAESEELFRKAFLTSPDSININRLSDGLYVNINDGFTAITGYTKDEIEGKTSKDINIWVNPVDREKLVKGLKENGSVTNLEADFRLKDGSIITGLMSAVIINLNAVPHILSITRNIDEIKNAQLRVKESEELFRNAFTTIPDSISISSLDDAVFRNINEGFTKITGYTEEEVIGKSSSEINLWADEFEREKLIERLKKDGTITNFETRFRIKSGEILTGLLSASVLKLNGKLNILAVTRDITDLKLIEDSLRKNEEKYRIVADNTTDWIYWIDEQKQFRYISPSVTNVTGYTQFDFKNNSDLLTDIIFEEDRQNVISHFSNLLDSTVQICSKEFRIVTKQGHVKWIFHRCRAVMDENGKFLGRRSSNRDITELKEAEFKLKESEKKYRAFFENDLTGDYISTVDGELLACNLSFARIFGYKDVEEAMSSNMKNIYLDDAARESFLNLLKENRNLLNFEYEYKKITGEKIYLIENTYGIFDDKNNLVKLQGYIFDNTQRKTAELQLIESEKRFKGLFDNAKLGIYRGTPEGELLYGNKALFETLGYNSIEDLKKLKAGQLYVNPAEREKFKYEMETKGFVSGFEELFYKGDNSIIVISESAHTVKDGNGNIIYYEGILEDITEKKENINLIKMQSDLLFQLQSETDIDKILDIAISNIVSIGTIDCGGIYLIENNDLLLKVNLGLSESFVNKIKLVKNGSYQYNIVKNGLPVFADYNKLNLPDNDPGFIEGIKEIAVIPLVAEGKILGCINAASRKEKSFSESVQNALTSIGSILSEIIERLNIFNELKKSEEKFRLVFENEINGFAYHEIITDKNGRPIDYRFVNINKGFEKIVGKKADEIVGKTVLEIWPDTELYWINTYGEVALKQNPISFENYSAPLEKYFHVNAYSPVKRFFAVSFNDITQRVEQEKSIQKLQRAVEQSQVSIVITDTTGKIEFVNPKFEEVTGYKADEVIGQNPRILKSGEISKEDYKLMWHELTEGKDWSGLFHNKKKNGELFWESVNISPIKNNEGIITNYIAVKEDITEKVKSEKELIQYKHHLENLVDERTGQLKTINIKLAEEIRKQKEFDRQLQDQLFMLSTFIESMPTAAFIKDSGLKFIEINHAFIELAGKEKKDIIGKTVFDVFPLEAAEIMNKQDQQVLKEKCLKSFNMTFVDNNNHEKYFIIKKTIYQKAYGEFGGILGTYIDFSEHKKLQESIERNLASEKELNELKTRFISMASHEFRTPLTSIRIFSDLIIMQRDKNDKEKLSEYTEKIQNSVTYMTDLINDVLTMSRVETGKLVFAPDNVDLKSFLEEMMNEAKLYASSKHNLILNYNSRKKVIYADSKLLRYIVSNLLSNAVKYSPNGGDIISTVDIKNSNLILNIKDSGIGMSDIVMKNLFEPFLRGDNIGNIQGTGLGLSIIKKAVDLHKGQINCSSVINEGTSFTITIPIIEE
ncbi:MAG: PAS domain S-box protein [Bacteroidetes bacterium]|nr:PAS domain S-box protein [Bacteroidota bacterium]